MEFDEYERAVRKYRKEDTIPTIYDLEYVAQLGPEAFLSITEQYYKGLVKLIHPDVGGDPETFVRVSLAIEKLRSDPAGAILRYFKNKRKVEGEEITTLRKMAEEQFTQLTDIINLLTQPFEASTFVTQYWASDYIPDEFDIWRVGLDRRAKVCRSKYPSVVSIDNSGTYYWHYDKVGKSFKPVNRGIKSTRDIRFEWFISENWCVRIKSGDRVIRRKEPYHLLVKQEDEGEIFVLGSINLSSVDSNRGLITDQEEQYSIGLLSGSSADDVLGHIIQKEEIPSVLKESTTNLVEGNQILYSKKAGDVNRLYLSWRPIAFHAISPLSRVKHNAR